MGPGNCPGDPELIPQASVYALKVRVTAGDLGQLAIPRPWPITAMRKRTYLESVSLTKRAVVTSKGSCRGSRVFRDSFQKACSCRARS